MFEDIATKTIELFNKLPGERKADIGLDSPLGDLGVDSLKLVEVVFELEETYAVEADEEQLTRLATVRDIVAMIESALQTAETVA